MMEYFEDYDEGEEKEGIDAEDSEKTIPVIEETIKVTKEVVETGKVRIHKKVIDEDADVEIPIISEELEIERIKLNQYVDKIPSVREENGTMIIPVMKEVVVKRLLLVEEVRVSRKKHKHQHRERVKLRKEKVTVDRTSKKGKLHRGKKNEE